MSARSHFRSPQPADRKAMLAKVHIARKELRLDEDSYRDVLRRVVGASSAASCTIAELDLLIAEFKRLGWKAPARRPLSGKPNVRMIHGLWKDLAPYLGDASAEALRAFVRRQTKSRLHPEGIDAPEFLDGPQANRVIEGLKAWLTRARAAAEGGST